MGTQPSALAIDSTRCLAKTTQTGNTRSLCEFVIRRKAYFCVLFHIRDKKQTYLRVSNVSSVMPSQAMLKISNTN